MKGTSNHVWHWKSHSGQKNNLQLSRLSFTTLLLFAVLLSLLQLSQVSAGGTHDPINPERVAFEKEIQTLKNFIDRNKDSNRNLGSQYAQLGFLYQSSDVRWHNGGKYKPHALENFNKALTYELSDSEKILVLQRKGMLLKMMSKGQEAISTHQQVLNMPDVSNYDASEAYLHIADAQSLMGEVSSALDSLRMALTLNPTNLEAYYPMVQACKELKCRNTQEWSELVQEMEMALKNSNKSSKKSKSRKYITLQDKFDDDDDDDDDDDEEDAARNGLNEVSTSIYWALYEAAFKADNIPLGWSYLDLAHKIELKKRKSFTMKSSEEAQRTALILQIFKKGFWPSGVGSTTKLPVFIVGMMRSGSTLLETILDAHPNIFGLGEDSIFNSHLPEVKDHVVQAASGTNDEVRDTVAKDAKLITTKMISMAKEMDEDASKGKILRVVDKMLFNYRNIGFIHLLFPQALILHTVRDPMDTLLSCFTQKFDDKGLEWAFQPVTLVEMYIDYLTIMNHFRNELPGRVLDVNYEEVVRQPERVVKNLIVNKLGLPWEDRVLSFHTSNRSVHTHSMHQVRQGLYVTSIGKWVKYKKQLEPIRKLLLPRMKEMLAKGQLPFPDHINWLLDPDYNYQDDAGAKDDEKKTNKNKKNEPEIKDPNPTQETQHPPERSTPTPPLSPSPTSKQQSKSKTLDPKSSSIEKRKESSKKEELEVSAESGNSVKSPKREDSELIGKTKKQKREKGDDSTKLDKEEKSPKKQGTRKRRRRPTRKTKRRPKKFSRTPFGKRFPKSSKKQKSKPSPSHSPSPVPVPDPARTPSSFTSSSKRNSLPLKEQKEKPSKQSSSSQSKTPITATTRKQMTTISREQIASLLKEITSTFPSDVVNHLAVIKTSLPYHSGEDFLDDLGAVSVALYNLGQLKQCIQFSQQVLQFNSSLHSVAVALASALAMEGKLEESLLSMNSLISDRVKSGLDIGPDVYERRAQVLMALGDTNSSIVDLTKAIKINPNVNSYTARASAFVREQRYWDAKKDAMSAIKLGANTAQLWNIVGRCEREFGEPEKAINAQTKALQLESTNKEALLEMAVTYMSISNARKALEYLEKCLALDPLLKNAHGYKGLLLQNMGRAKDTINAFQEAYKIDPTDTQALQFTAISYQAMGDYKSAIEWFEKTLLVDPDHYVWSLREIAYYRWKMLDIPFDKYNPDTDIHWLLKDAWIRRAPLRNYCGPGRNPWCHYKLTLHDPKEVSLLSTGTEGISMSKFYNQTHKTQFKELVTLTSPISRWIQVDSPGFLKHERQHKMFGVMVLEMAQQLITHFHLFKKDGEGLKVPDESKSRRVLIGKEEESNLDVDETEDEYGDNKEISQSNSDHIFGWRDFFDLAVKWRQIAEPFDTVFWIDCTAAQEDQADKVGLQTFLYHGVGKNIRYYPYFNKTFTLLKQLAPSGFYVGVDNFTFKLPPQSSHSSIEQARTLKEFLDALQPLYVLTPLLSRRTPEQGPLEGTRIAVSHVSPKGENLYISTGTSYERYERYYKELQLAFDRVVEWAVQTNAPNYNEDDPETAQAARDEGLDRCLELYYYWINFSPLSRGSAAVGYASIVACMVSFGDIPTNPLPKGIQLDWEAILTLSPEEFIKAARPFLQTRTRISSFLPPACWLQKSGDGDKGDNNESCLVKEIVKTARDAIYLMNGMYDSSE